MYTIIRLSHIIFFIFLCLTGTRNSYCMEQQAGHLTLTQLREKLEPHKIGEILNNLPPSINIVETEKPGERLGKCMYVAMTDLIGITHESAPFKMLDPRDWIKNINLQEYFNQTDTPQKGDLAVYYPDDQNKPEPLHFSIVTNVNSTNNVPVVRSKWGIKSEIFEHELYTAPLSYQTSAKFFRLKPEYQQEGTKTVLLAKLQNAMNNSEMIKENIELLQRLLSEFANGNNIVIAQDVDLNQYKSIQDKIRYLLKSYPGLDINGYGRSIYTPLMLAAMRGDYETTKLLIDFGADVNKQNKDGNTALIMAYKRRREDIIPLLINAGANPEITNNYGDKVVINSK